MKVAPAVKYQPIRFRYRTAHFGLCFILSFSLVILVFSSCTQVKSPSPRTGYPKPYRVGTKWYQPLPHAKNFVQRGIASWYGKDFHGKKTANGEIYNMHAMTAAHKTLPLGIFVRVRHLKNKREIEVRINDRGPFVRGRIIDLSFAAAKKIGLVGPGTGPVEVVALGAAAHPGSAGKKIRTYVPVDYFSGNFTIQVGAFQARKNAVKLWEKLDRKFKNAHIATHDTGSRVFYRVRVGKCSTLGQALQYEKYMIENGFKAAFVVAE